jgi:hypothetical protein
MAGAEPSAIKRFILWDYRRATWQYDVMVGLILAFIFFTPRDLFRDRPRPIGITMVSTQGDTHVYWIEPALLSGVPEADQSRKVLEKVKERYGKQPSLERLEPIHDDERELIGYKAFVKPN